MKKSNLLLLILAASLSLPSGCQEEGKDVSPLALFGDSGIDLPDDPGIDPDDPIDPGIPGYAGPVSVTATDGTHGDRIGLNWELVDDAVTYNIYRSSSAGGPYQAIGSVGADDLNAEPVNPPVDPPVTPPADPPVMQATFQSDVNLNQEFVVRILFIPVAVFYGVYAEAQTTYQIRIKLGATIDKLVTFKGGLGGEYYTQEDVIAKINAAAGKTICSGVTVGSNKYIRIVSTDGAITLENNFVIGMITPFPPLRKFLKQDAGWNTVIRVEPVEVDDGSTTGTGTSTDPDTGTTPGPSYCFTDTDITAGMQYFYVVTAVNAAGSESEYTPEDDGYAKPDSMPGRVTGVSASDGAYADRVAITWNAADKATFYRVYRTKGTSVVQVGGDIDGTSYNDASVTAGLCTYRVVGCNPDSTGLESAPDSGYRAISNQEFFDEAYREVESGLNRLTLIKKTGTGKLGSETIEDRAGSGTLYYKASGGLSSATVLLQFTDFCDNYLALNGTQTTSVSDPLGDCNGTITGTLSVTGLYCGSIRFDLTLVGEAVTAGSYYVSQNGGAETAIPYTYVPK
ncbi:MAG TPA: hypothetical protein PLA65_08065 [Spirochaetota bacterium]|nr:hypothetical protein [Spirochaetota bacterium]HOD15253.1 hypothetical protein [Spirochaetota bacterium]HPG51033.1 hypothetical protein [Spirochaetota bacterium]HPN12001.1 hypothetical protein [Spirochaetota bacterium]